jgi:hypothetical protein
VNDTSRAGAEKAARPAAPELTAAGPDEDPDGEPVPYTLTARAEAVLASWDRYLQLSRDLEAEAGQ